MPDTSTQLPHTVFVSHAHADNELCDRYVDALRKRGLDVWYDRTNMQIGHSLSADIETELRKRTAFVVMATPAALASQWVRSEIAAFRYLAAQDPTRLFVPVRAAACEMPLLWVDILWIDAESLSFDAAIDALAIALRAPTLATSAPSTAEVVRAPIEGLSTQATAENTANLVKYGEELYMSHRYAEALAADELVLKLEPTNVQAWIDKGYALGGLKRNAEALAIFDQALALDPRAAPAWVGKGWALHLLERDSEALALLERALTLDSTNAMAWHGKGIVLNALGRTKEADEALRHAEKLERKG